MDVMVCDRCKDCPTPPKTAAFRKAWKIEPCQVCKSDVWVGIPLLVTLTNPTIVCKQCSHSFNEKANVEHVPLPAAAEEALG